MMFRHGVVTASFTTRSFAATTLQVGVLPIAFK